ncbi:UNVERIFIED_CONTAM: hypothetical protein GTU68_047776 [Idotea baltica]|nr:hypothetical protein [Idotea baltica]
MMTRFLMLRNTIKLLRL